MIQIEKKKRTHSGSRSKSKKYRGYEYSVDLRGKNPTTDWTKVKTQNSSSLNRSRPSRKNSTKQKKHTKSNNRDSKDPASHSVSADRRHSITKPNRTQANFDGQQIEIAVDQLIMGLRSIPQPRCVNARLLGQYFSSINKYFSKIDGPLNRLCTELHSLYMNPMQRFLQLVAPMQDVIQRKEEITRQIDKQIIQNEELYSKLEPIDIEIFKLKQKIEENRALIEEKRQNKLLKNQQDKQAQKEHSPEYNGIEKEMKIMPIAKLDLKSINKKEHLGYHDEFYSKIDEFSESWREQALREKRC